MRKKNNQTQQHQHQEEDIRVCPMLFSVYQKMTKEDKMPQ